MTSELLFCLTSLLFLAWVILLKIRVVDLQNRIRDLEAELAQRRASRISPLDVSRDTEVWETHPEE